MKMHAESSGCGQYRYLLDRRWGGVPDGALIRARILVACMLNPSTADARQDDATIRWLIGWAKKHGYDALRVVNLAAYRATSPRDMMAAADPHGPENTSYLMRYSAGKQVLCAWGTNGQKLPRYDDMLDTGLRYAELMCLTTNKDGSPAHPLRRSHSLELRRWPGVILT